MPTLTTSEMNRASSSSARDFDEEATDHPDHRYAYAFDYHMHRFMMRRFSAAFRPGNALELGCFHGHFTSLLCEEFDHVEVVEASRDCIAIAEQTVKSKAKFHHHRFESFAPDKTYDNIFLIHTLEHLDDRVGTLARIARWLSPTGRLFVATPNANAASRQIAVGMGLIRHASAVTEAELAHGHRVTYNLDTLSADLREAGLSLHDRGGVMFKGLANFQMDAALSAGIISDAYLEGAYLLGQVYPDLCSSIYCVVTAA